MLGAATHEEAGQLKRNTTIQLAESRVVGKPRAVVEYDFEARPLERIGIATVGTAEHDGNIFQIVRVLRWGFGIRIQHEKNYGSESGNLGMPAEIPLAHVVEHPHAILIRQA